MKPAKEEVVLTALVLRWVEALFTIVRAWCAPRLLVLFVAALNYPMCIILIGIEKTTQQKIWNAYATFAILNIIA